MKNTGLVVAILLVALSSRAQITYNAPTSVSVIDYPATIPCPYNGAACRAGHGSLTGANYCLVPSEFPNTTICRVTDQNTVSTNRYYFNTSCDAGSEVNDWNINDDRFTICAAGNTQMLFSFNTATNTATQDTSFVSPGSTSPYFSYTQPYIMYHGHLNDSNDLAIFSYDTTSLGNPAGVPVVDIGTACSIAGLTRNSIANMGQGVTVSGDDQTFGVLGSSTVGQGSSGMIYVVAWNRTNGCCYWNTNTGSISGAGCIQTGTVDIADRFTVHNTRLGKGGTWMKVAPETCTGTCTTGEWNYFWQVGTTHVTIDTGRDGCGHTAAGYSHRVNKCNGATDPDGLFSAPFDSPDTTTSLPASYPSPSGADGAHISWANDNSSDSNPFIAIFQGTSVAVVHGWDNEILAVSPNGGNVYRLLHTYATPALLFTPGSVSQDGKYVLWTTDWDGMLGNADGRAVACTAGTTNCRTDVFVAVLPLNGSSFSSAPTGLTIIAVK